MRHPTATLALLSSLLLVGLGLGATGCGDDDAEASSEAVSAEDDRGDRLPGGGGDAEPACVRFCDKSLACAEADGRPVPPAARDCERSCAPGGIHHNAPPGVWACADEPCGEAFTGCAQRGMIAHMRDSQTAAFPAVCEGLCEKAAYCARRLGQPVGEAERDCAAACEEGGSYASLDPGTFECVDAACGTPFETCRTAGGLDEEE